jgi:hypothetical protein
MEDEPGHSVEHPPSERSASPANANKPASSGLSSAKASSIDEVGHDISQVEEASRKQPERSYKLQKKRWTLPYSHYEQQRIRDAVDAIMLKRLGPAKLSTTQKRRHTFLRNLSEEQIDNLANGRSIDMRSQTPMQQKPKPQKERKRYTKKSGHGSVDRFMELEVMPLFRVSSTAFKNALIVSLSREELMAIQENDQAEKEKIVEKLKKQSKALEIAPKYNPSKKQKTYEM